MQSISISTPSEIFPLLTLSGQSATSTNCRGEPFVGASPIFYIDDLNQLRLHQGPIELSWSNTAAGGQIYFSGRFVKSSTMDPATERDWWYRIICHAILTNLPDAAMQEVLSSLQEARSWYKPPVLPVTRFASDRGELIEPTMLSPTESKPFALSDE